METRPGATESGLVRTHEAESGYSEEHEESGLVRIPIWDIFLSPENDLFYRPISEDDEDIQALAESIEENGLLEPIVVTELGHFILSGHRRFMACRVAGLIEIECRTVSVAPGSPEFVRLLAEYNRQRVKTAPEEIRECLIASGSSDGRGPVELIRAHREKKASVDVEAMSFRRGKKRAKITDAKAPMLEAAIKAMSDHLEYMPHSLRQIHYLLLNDPPLKNAGDPDSVYRNDEKSYKNLSEILTRARLEKRFPMEWMTDETRPVTLWAANRSVGEYMRGQIDEFWETYYRDLLQSQPNHIEILVEKKALQGIVEKVAGKYRIPATMGGGYCSIPPRMEMVDRFRKSGKDKLVLILLSDFDPDGIEIAESFCGSLQEDFDIPAEKIHPVRAALNESQISEFRLENGGEAKKTSSNYRKFKERYGEKVFELEALHPDSLVKILEQAVLDVLDIEAFRREQARENLDRHYLRSQKQALKKILEPRTETE